MIDFGSLNYIYFDVSRSWRTLLPHLWAQIYFQNGFFKYIFIDWKCRLQMKSWHPFSRTIVTDSVIFLSDFYMKCAALKSLWATKSATNNNKPFNHLIVAFRKNYSYTINSLRNNNRPRAFTPFIMPIICLYSRIDKLVARHQFTRFSNIIFKRTDRTILYSVISYHL